MTKRKSNLEALALSVLAHTIFLLTTWRLDLFPPVATPDAAAADLASVELFLEPAPPEAVGSEAKPTPERPTSYIDVPERLQAAEPPSRADFLALVNSRAADELPGGEADAAPSAPLVTDATQVAIRREELDAGGGALAVLPPPAAARERTAPPRGAETPAGGGWPLPEGSPDISPGEGRAGPEADAAEGAPDGLTEQARQAESWQWDLGEVTPRELLTAPASGQRSDRPARDVGDRLFEFDQLATGRRESNALAFGPYQLNTYEWNFAPWMQRFGQDLRRNWLAPYAYRIGVISGLTQMRVVVEPDGRLSALELRHQEGHESLHFASEAAVKGAAPFAPLPPGFPEEHLEIILTLVYPDWHALLSGQESGGEPKAPDTTPRRGRR